MTSGFALLLEGAVMEVAAYIVELRRDGELLAAAAERDELNRAIPPCPG
jgi:hypothetical protein